MRKAFGFVFCVALNSLSSANIVYIGPEDQDRLLFSEDTTVNITDDLLYHDIYIQENPLVVSSSKGAIWHSTGNLFIQSNNAEALSSIVVNKVEKTNGYDTLLNGHFYAVRDLSFSSLNEFIFKESYIDDSANGLVAGSEKGNITFRDIGNILIENNHASKSGLGSGGFISANSGSVLFENIDSAIFKGNTIDEDPSGKYTYTGSVVYSSVSDQSRYGASFKNINKVEFSDNVGTRAISSISGALFSNVGDLTFRNNYCRTNGGAILNYSHVGSEFAIVFVQNGDVIFLNNRADSKGGAISINLSGETHTNLSLLLSADKGDICFKGNLHDKSSIANAIYVSSVQNKSEDFGRLDIRAQEGKEVSFYDPIVTGQTSTQPGMAAINLNGNADPSHVSTQEIRRKRSSIFWRDNTLLRKRS